MMAEEAFAELQNADSPEVLWQLLVTTPGRELAQSLAVEFCSRHHSNGEPGAVDSALLLCTDWRWRRTSGLWGARSRREWVTCADRRRMGGRG